MNRAVLGTLVALALCGAAHTGLAQQSSSAGAAPVANNAPLVAPDSIAPFERPNGTLIHPALYVYQLSLIRNGVQTPLGTRTVEVTDASAGGVPGWLIAERRTGSAVPTSDSLWVTRADLTPERWAATIDHAQLGVSFTRDSAFGAVQSYRGRASFAAAVPPGALLTGGMVERVIELLPLRDGYRAAASLLLFDLATPRALDAEIFVERSERTRIGSADVDCWVVTLRAGVLEQRLWVSRQSPRVVRTEQATAGGVLVGVVQ
ncbi:MAG TPA: hypothetical protein VGP25_21790 [Gemmatimonadaceae bacterium]|nr:hypothetical protein [Gemmatimonadaceae bacterium]